ncbi:serine/threonine-protein kinase [Streptomyces iconiensis]|uniref:Serine/threonine-protein kinase n=1 Tax=Streptomyces iconiensis TaxID=1384038 RepID=A0ABT6ZUP5_9ACTN|nr:serine/threonine-protein kinase [Streptomyces iconiensis]MDJ1132775.1 serine/threonine-protein kinase [Streptomyces iconiensis]
MEPLRATDPRQIGEYRLLGRLGAGGMGSVYLAQSPRGRTVAVKLVRSDLAERTDFRRRFEREVRAARKVGGEWTAPVLDAETDAEQPWLATGYIPGIPLHDAVEGQSDPLPARTVRILANRLALALGSVHEAGLIHRDVKPSNILVTIDGPRLIDFGIAWALEQADGTQLTQTGVLVGSPAFMSPEQARGRRLTAASDIFSLGSALVFAATGRVPFGDTGLAAHALLFRVAEDEPDLSQVPDGLRALLGDCLAKDPAERPSLAEIAARTADPEDEPGPGPRGNGNSAAEPWLPAGLVAQLGQHAARLLDAEVPGAREAADRAADAYVMSPAAPAPAPAPTQSSHTEQPRVEPPRTGLGSPAYALPTVYDRPPAVPPPGPPPRPAGSGAQPPDDSAGTPARSASGKGQHKGRSKERGTWRRPGVLAAGVALVLIAGGGTLLALPGVGPFGEEKKADAPQGDLPKKYLGSWKSVAKAAKGDEPITRTIDIEQGRKGETVAHIYSTYTNQVCSSPAALASYDGVLRLRAEPATSDREESCPQHPKQDLAYENKALAWSASGRRESALLHRVSGRPKNSVPKAMSGKWEMTGELVGDGTNVVEFSAGSLGESRISFAVRGKGAKEECAWEADLGAVEPRALVYGGVGDKDATLDQDAVAYEACGDLGLPVGEPIRVTMRGSGEVRLNSLVFPGKPVILKRAG